MESLRINVCRDCRLALRQSKTVAKQRQQLAPIAQQSTWTRATTNGPRYIPKQRAHIQQTSRRFAVAKDTKQHRAQVPPPPSSSQGLDLNALHTRIQELTSSVLKPSEGDEKLPSEQRVLYVFEQLEAIATKLLDERTLVQSAKQEPQPAATPKQPQQQKRQETATSALLGSVNATKQPVYVSKASLLSLLSEKAHEIVRHPRVFISPAVLKAYVELQSLLGQPWSFPDIFDAYARKPTPVLKGSDVEYKPVSPDNINAAIDSKTANTALSAAMLAHDLPLAIDIVTTTFATPAFRKAKALRQAVIPIGGLAVMPVAAYTLSSSYANLQQTMDPSMATGIAFAGIMTYVGAVSMVGYVAITTANDQMDRVTWATGVPLWERWLREDERAAADRLAGAWGFKDKDKRGEEEGDEWDMLREWVGVRGMVLDRVNLMEGME